MEVKKYVIDLSLSDRLEELKDSFFDDIAFVKYSDHKVVVETMQEEIVSYATTISDMTETIIKMQNKIDELTAEKNKTKAEHFNVMRILSDENKTEMEISMLEQMADDWMNNWIAK